MSFALDDSGTRATGKWIANATVSLDHALTANDLLYISANHDLGHGQDGARGTKGMSAHYSVPFGYWLLAFNSSNNRYFQNVAGLNVNYVYKPVDSRGRPIEQK
jgi:hemolysin activation/secretion protein